MMSNVAVLEQPQKQSLIATMASKFNMDPKAFEQTVRSTVMPSQHTNEQFAALMMVAKEYDLNPLTKEIYAFPAKGGGIVPVVSIDGWVNLVNSHPAADGFEFEFEHSEDGKELISCTCRMYRKDRGRPVTVTEYLSECVRSSEPWKMKHRMLRHKAMIQAARYAFGFSGIYDEDEGRKIAEMRDVTPAPEAKQTPPKPPRPPAPPVAKTIEAEAAPMAEDDGAFDLGAFLENIETSLAGAKDEADVEEIWTDFDAPAVLESAGHADMIDAAFSIKDRRLAQLSTLNGG